MVFEVVVEVRATLREVVRMVEDAVNIAERSPISMISAGFGGPFGSALSSWIASYLVLLSRVHIAVVVDELLGGTEADLGCIVKGVSCSEAKLNDYEGRENLPSSFEESAGAFGPVFEADEPLSKDLE